MLAKIRATKFGRLFGNVELLILRLFLGQFWILQMVGKARDQESGVTSIGNLGIWAKNTADWMVKTTPLPEVMVRPFTTMLPFVELALGLAILFGLATRHALVASALVLISLDVGLMFQLKHDVVAMNTIYLFATLFALRALGPVRAGSPETASRAPTVR